MFSSVGIASLLALSVGSASGFDITRGDNVEVYWGQDSYGASGGAQSGWQQPIGNYCQDDSINIIPIAFVDVFFDPTLPDLNLANTCNPTDDPVFAGTNLANCGFLTAGIEACQAAGKIVTISMGGASGAAVFTSDAQGEAFANTIWDLFLGGSSSTRPFGSAVLDGVDLDIEGGGPTGFAAFVNQIRTLAQGADKTYYITAAPQCPYPDAYIGSALNAAKFDIVSPQFYNNYCSVNNAGNSADWDFASWDTWAKTVSLNPDVKIYIGAPAAPAAGAGYIDAAALGALAVSTRQQYSSFGGVMLWDASQAAANGNFAAAVKNIIATAGGGSTSTKTTSTKTTSSTTTTKSSTTTTTTSKTTTSSSSKTTTTTSSVGTGCSGTSAWTAAAAYPSGSIVTYNGDLWTANQWNEDEVPGGSSGAWVKDGACAGALQTVAGATAAAKTAAATLTGSKAKATVVESRKNSRAFKV